MQKVECYDQQIKDATLRTNTDFPVAYRFTTPHQVKHWSKNQQILRYDQNCQNAVWCGGLRVTMK